MGTISKALLYSAAALVASLGLASAIQRSSYALTFSSDFIGLLIMVLAGVAFLRNAWHSAGRTRAAWSLLVGMQLLYVVGQVLWIYFEVFLQRNVPNPFVGDVLFFLAVVPAMAAVILRPHLEPSEQDRHLGILDFTLLLLFWLYLYLFFVIPWQYVSFNEVNYGPPYNFLVLAAETVLAAGFALAWFQSSGRWRQVYAAAAVVSVVDASSTYLINAAIDRHDYFTGSWYDVYSAVGLAGWVLVAVVGFDLGPSQEHRDPTREKYWLWSSRLAAPVRLTLPLLAGWAFLDTHVPEEVRAYRVVLTLTALVVLGVVATTKQLRLDKQLARAHQELLEASLTDSLTGVHNRRFFTNSIASDVQQALRSYSPNAGAGTGARNRDLLFYLVDADHFKEVNDRFGHDVGDQVLVEITRRISTAIRHSDTLVRWGGEEFLVVSRYTDRADAASLAKRVLDAVGAEPFVLQGVSIRRTCSVGWAAFPWRTADPGAVTYEQVLAFADQALYEAKHSGRNQAIGMLPLEAPSGGSETTPQPTQLAASTLVTPGPVVPKQPWPEEPTDGRMSLAPEGI